MRAVSLRPLLSIPGVGKSIAADLYSLGIREVADLKGKNPQALYEQLNQKAGIRLDPCLLYTFRCAVYFASTSDPKPELLKWWAWKERKTMYETGEGNA